MHYKAFIPSDYLDNLTDQERERYFSLRISIGNVNLLQHEFFAIAYLVLSIFIMMSMVHLI